MAVQNFREMIAANKRNSVLLVICFCLFVMVTAMVLTFGIMAYIDPSLARRIDWQRSLLVGGGAFALSLLFSAFAYYSGANVVLAVSGARRIEHQDDPELFNVVEEMAVAAGIPMPQVYIIDDPAPNAFATGRDPEHAAVTITTGLRAKLTRDELQGVVAHEVSHIRNYDIRLMLLLAVLVGMIAMLSDMFWQILRWGPSRGSSRSDSNDKGGNAIMLVLMIVAIVLAIIAPILAQIIQLAVSRQREYLADASAVELTRYPQGLADALKKIGGDREILESANSGTAHLYITNPLRLSDPNKSSVFSSHPPLQDRIKRLLALVREYPATQPQ